MEEDAEVLDWGNEDDELHSTDGGLQQKQLLDDRNGGEEEDDAVSLGDDEDEDIYPYKPVSQDETATHSPNTPPSFTQQNGSSSLHEVHRESSVISPKSSRHHESLSLRRTQSAGKMMHALPPKPIVAPPTSAHSPATQNTSVSAMIPRERKPNGHGNLDSSSQSTPSLPPDWEERYPRDGGTRGPYYYNVRTEVSTWIHPGTTSSGVVSPAKDKDSSGARSRDARSPEHVPEDEISIPPRREAKRRPPPLSVLSYEDRHYRPSDDAAKTAPNKSADRRDLYSTLPPRPASPRTADVRYVARTSTPPPSRPSLDQGRGARSRRERSPSLDRHSRRDRSREQVQLSSQDRTWHPSRNDSPPLSSGRTADGRSAALRGRHDRLHAEPFLQSQSAPQGVRDDNSEWTASRLRSPSPHLREATLSRRLSYSTAYVDRSPASTPRQNSRPEHSPSLSRSGHTDTYAPPENIPQRRAREDFAYHPDVKRRRVDRSPAESARLHESVDSREPRLERPNVTPRTSSPIDMSQEPRKRPPLLPQSMQFRQASESPSLPGPAPPTPGSQHFSNPLSVHRAGKDSNVPPIGQNNSPNIPSGPRNQVSLQSHDLRISGRSRNALDGGHLHLARDNDAMEIDPIPLPKSASGRLASNANFERGTGLPSVLPTAPRAMSKTSATNWEKRDVAPRPSNPPPKITGSNNTPIGDRRPTREHSGGRDSPAGPEANRYRQQPSPIYSEAEKSRYPDDLSRAPSRSASYHSGSPVDRLKVLPPVTEPSSRWPDARISKDFPSPPPHHPPSPRLSPADLDSNRMARKDAAERSVRTTRFGPGPDQILPATDTQPRKWLTREEAERSGLAVQTPSTSTGRSFNARPPSPSAPSSRDERRLHEAGRQADDKGRRSFEDPAGKQRTFETFGSRREETRTDNSPGDRPVTERPSLEGRLSSTRGRDAVSFEDRLLDRSAVDESERATIKTHPDRARFLVSSPQLSEPLAFTNGARSSHTSKSRRKGRPFEQNGGVSVSQDDHDTLAESKDSDVQRAAPDSPPARPGATLLDRLTEPTTDRSSPSSLRDRVHPPVSGIAGLPPRPPAELSYDAINSNDGGSKGGRGPPRRRSAKPRKGRKVDETKVHEAGLPR